jgi:tubulin---tyrosine ligase
MVVDKIDAFVSWPTAPLTNSLVRNALSQLQLELLWADNSDATNNTQSGDHPFLQWATYDAIDHEKTHLYTNSVLSSSYIFRKALIRKHFLARSVKSYNTKYPESILAKAVPQTWEMEISFADELDEMFVATSTTGSRARSHP